MRELHYAFYCRTDIRVQVLTCLAEAILHKQGRFVRNKFVIKRNSDLSYPDQKILRKFRLGKRSKIYLVDIKKWKKHLRSILVQDGYCYRFLGLHFKTKKFKRAITEALENEINPHIANFIETGDKMMLEPIIPEIDKVRFINIVQQGKASRGLIATTNATYLTGSSFSSY